MTWWTDLVAYLVTQWNLAGQNALNWSQGWGFGNVVTGFSTTVGGLTDIARQVLVWMPAIWAMLPVILVLWFLDVAVTALTTGDVKPLGTFVSTITSILIGIASAIGSALPL